MYKLRDQKPRGVCAVEGCANLSALKLTRRDGIKMYRAKCQRHHTSPEKLERDRTRCRNNLKLRKFPYTKFKKGCCEFCGFVPKHPCQLDVDHINGDHSDNSEENLQTLCANCHRLKTYENKDWEL